MQGYLRSSLIGIGLIASLLTIGFTFQLDWATALWPWSDSRLSYIFLGSIAAAIATPVLWIGLSGELGAVPGGAINIAAMAAGTSGYLLTLYLRRDDSQLLVSALVLGLLAIVSVGLFVYTRRIPLRDRRPMPGLVRLSFGLFGTALIAVAIALLSGADHIFPWPLRSETSVMIGWIFLGASLYFLYALRRPFWHDATGQLIGFLAYDLVLIGPFLRHFERVLPEHRLSLVIYTSVLVYSGALAIYFLFIDPATRLWGAQAPRVEHRGAD